MKQIVRLLPIPLLIAAFPPAYPHGGGLDSNGCHTNSKTGERHCHRGNGSTTKLKSGMVTGPVTLVSVGDGDTVRITDKAGNKVTIRLACIDAPETSQGNSGKWSTETLKGLIQGKPISLKPQIKDRYGRTVAEIYQGSTNVNLQMVKRGAAFAYRRYLKQCDSDAYLSAETTAMNRKLGVWGPYKVDLKPWDYRRSRRRK
ncbi:putative nuclease [Synechococcus sp. MEDNS5]|nr:putative nuclease [Synechococcus sp. MEDNS5]